MKSISTSQLAKKHGIYAKDLFNRFLDAGLIVREEEAWKLTEQGKREGKGDYKTHKTHGTYIVWPEDITIPKGHTTISATALGKKFNIPANRINHILLELGWIKKDIKGWRATNDGKAAGGVQNEDSRSGIPYVAWDEKILTNPVFKKSIDEAQGISNTTTEKKSQSNNFREKFEAKHRTADGHFVRSKAEMIIDNFLYTAGIVHAYERMLPVEEEVYCDFYLPNGRVYIEFWGYDNDSKYLARKQKKQEIYKKYGYSLIELTDEEVLNLDDVLPKMLLKHGIQAY